jgi:hypothetical protein
VTLHFKIGWEESKHVGLAQQNWFGPAFLHSLLRLVKNRAKPLAPATEECNKYDLTTDPYCRLVNYKDCSRWFAIRI